MSNTISFDYKDYDKSKKIIIFGASSYGEIIYWLLKSVGINISFFCDRDVNKKEIFGCPIISSSELAEYSNDYIIIASADCYNEMYVELKKQDCNFICDALKIFEIIPKDFNGWSAVSVDIYDHRQNYIYMAKASADSVIFPRIQYVVSERCSLKCKDCIHLMQYYEKPLNVDLEKYKESFEKLLRVSDSITELRILGGEPFMNKEMYKIIDWFHDSDKIKDISIYTNGTIVPSEDIFQRLKMSKVRVRISDYVFNREKIDRFVEELEKRDIGYFISQYDDWQDAGNIDFRGDTVDILKKRFSQCIERNCITFYKGELHRCPRSVHAMNLCAMPRIERDYINLEEWTGTDSELKTTIREFLKMDYIEACNYCDGPNRFMQSIPAAIQTPKPLSYKKI